MLGQRAFAAGFLVAGVLVFTWPFVRAPAPPRARVLSPRRRVALVVIGLAAMSRALSRAGREPGSDEDEHRG